MPTGGDWTELQTDGTTEIPLSLTWDPDMSLAAGLLVSWEADGTPRIEPLDLVDVEPPDPPMTPLAPALTGTQPTRTSTNGQWVASDNTGRPPVSGWEVERRISTNDRATFGAWAPITGSPFSLATTSFSQSGLSSGTPEHVFQYRVRGVNSDGPGEWSNTLDLQWQVVVLQQPAAPTGFASTGSTQTTRTLGWTISAPDSSVTKLGVFEGSTLRIDNIDPGARSVIWQGLSAGSTHTSVTVRQFNGWNGGTPPGWSPASNAINFTQPTDPPPPSVPMLMGTSDAGNGQGGFANWDLWRVYTKGARDSHANEAATQALFYSENGFNLGSNDAGDLVGTYNSVRTHVLDDLNAFYYTSATGQTHTGRWGVSLYWLNGNENSDKGSLRGTHTAARIAHFVEMQRALYDACHFIDPTTGNRRFPDAYAGSNPTQNHEQSGIVADWLHPSAQYHDIVVWSMYPPGRQTTVDDPTYNWPSFLESRRTNLQDGFLIRCFYRTKQAEAQARIDRGQPGFVMQIGCGEVGTGQDPGDSTTRPYYAVHALAGGMAKLSTQYNLPMPGACWWDNSKGATSPQNIFNDEPGTTNPSTAEAWRGWEGFNHQFGGTHPAAWANNPKAGWKSTGTPV